MGYRDALFADHLASFELPAGRFFTPTAAFWACMDQPAFRAITWVDAGAGSGELTQELLDHGYRALAVDCCPREGQLDLVLRLDARDVPYSTTQWPLICRPNHAGWAEEVIETALARGAHVLYVGLADNAERDLGEFFDRATVIATAVGNQDEAIWQLR